MTYELSSTDNGLVRLRAIDPDSPTGYVRTRYTGAITGKTKYKDWGTFLTEDFARAFALRQLAPGSAIARLRLVSLAEVTQ